MRYLMDPCINHKATRQLQLMGFDCVRWKGDPRTKDKELATQALAQERVMVSADWDFVEVHRRLNVSLGYHIHVIGRKKDQPRLLTSRISDLESKMKACGPGLYQIEADKEIAFERCGAGSARKLKKKR